MWVKEYSPTKSDWYIIVVDGKRFPAMYNDHNKFWCGQDGKTYKPNEVEWLNDGIDIIDVVKKSIHDECDGTYNEDMSLWNFSEEVGKPKLLFDTIISKLK